jgi:hypothetical protein
MLPSHFNPGKYITVRWRFSMDAVDQLIGRTGRPSIYPR